MIDLPIQRTEMAPIALTTSPDTLMVISAVGRHTLNGCTEQERVNREAWSGSSDRLENRVQDDTGISSTSVIAPGLVLSRCFGTTADAAERGKMTLRPYAMRFTKAALFCVRRRAAIP